MNKTNQVPNRADNMNTNQYYKAPKQVEHIKTEKVKLVVHLITKGYINLYSKKKVEIVTKKHLQKVKVYRSRITLKFAQLKEATINKMRQAKATAQTFVQSCLFEATLNNAKKALQDARRAYLSTSDTFTLFVDYCRALNNLRSFKYSLPRIVRNQIF